MKRIHISKEPISFDAARIYEQKPHFKPHGLWYGIGNAWIEWCLTEQPEWAHKHGYALQLERAAKILKISSAVQLLKFTERYSTCGDLPTGLKFFKYIDWPMLASEFDGIEINPYIYQCRHHPQTFWYYGWDCASGCVWSLNRVKLTPVKALELQAVTK